MTAFFIFHPLHSFRLRVYITGTKIPTNQWSPAPGLRESHCRLPNGAIAHLILAFMAKKFGYFTTNFHRILPPDIAYRNQIY